MDTGLLWFDNDPRRGLEEKVQRAAHHYRRKYGHRPNMCFVHASALDGQGGIDVGDIAVQAGRAVLPHHFWIGVQEERTRSQDEEVLA
jgi:hypothetical protein